MFFSSLINSIRFYAKKKKKKGIPYCKRCTTLCNIARLQSEIERNWIMITTKLMTFNRRINTPAAVKCARKCCGTIAKYTVANTITSGQFSSLLQPPGKRNQKHWRLKSRIKIYVVDSNIVDTKL